METAVEAAFIKLLKNGEVVAIAGMDDTQMPSSFSLIYRETVDDDTEFQYTLDALEVAVIQPKSQQVGIKIYGDCYTKVTDELPDAC